MILVLSPDTGPESPEYKQLLTHLANLPGISTRVRTEVGSEQTLTEVYLIGNTKALPIEDMQTLPCVERVVRISEEYRVLGRHKNDNRPTYFDYNGVRFGQDTLNVFAGLCAVDTLEHVELMMQDLSARSAGIQENAAQHGYATIKATCDCDLSSGSDGFTGNQFLYRTQIDDCRLEGRPLV